MKQYTRHIILFMPLLLLASCVSEVDWPRDKEKSGEGSFSLSLSAGGLNAEVETRADGDKWRRLTDVEASGYQVTLTHAGETLWGPKAFGDVIDRDCTQPAGTGYVVSGGNCTAEEAESGWGQPHYSGQSEPFEVKNGETTPVEVKCRMQNAGFCVVFDQTFTDRFPTTYAVTTNDARSLRFDNGNAAVFEDNTLQGGAIAYYNMEADGKRTVSLIVTGANDWDRVRLEKDIDMEPGKIYRLLVRVGGENGKMGLSITYDSEFELVEKEIVVEE